MPKYLPLALTVVGAVSGQIQFQESAARSGIDFVLHNGATGQFHQVELMMGGVAALDYDADGCYDLFFTNGAALPSLRKSSAAFHNRLYRGDCKGGFTAVTAKTGVAGEGYSMAAAAADYDNDGRTDIFVAGVNRNILYHNEGNGTFRDVTIAAGVEGKHPRMGKLWSVSAGWMDADNDGRLDLFVSNYVTWNPVNEPRCGSPERPLYCHPDRYPGQPNQLFRNKGDGTFADVSESSGFGTLLGKGMGLAFGDYNADGRMDVYVANDSMRNYLYENLGGMKFKEVGLETGASLSESGRAVASMGVDFRDADNDGRPDLFFTAMVNDTYPYFHNAGAPLFFEDRTLASGLALATRTLTGWGMGLMDFDNDGWKDLFFANGHFPRLEDYLGASSDLPNSVFRNTGNARFTDVSKAAGLTVPAQHRGAAFADFDNDGRLDAAVSALNAPARLYLNRTVNPGGWIAFRLSGRRSNRDGLGATIELTLSGGRKLWNHATTSAGYGSSSEPLVRFGIGSGAAEKAVVKWPSGAVQTLDHPTANGITVVTEPPR